MITIEDGVAVVRMDDGKANAVGFDLIDALHAALDRATDEATAVAILGREGRFSAGFDLSVMTGGGDVRKLVQGGGELLMRIYGHPQPVVAGVSGHALAAGALLALSCDTRIGAAGSFKIGLNETAIGMALPEFAIELARERLSKRWFTRCVLQAEIVDPDGAVEAGYLDRVVDAADVESTVVDEARRLGQLSAGAYRTTKRKSRAAVIERVLAGLDDDMAQIAGPS